MGFLFCFVLGFLFVCLFNKMTETLPHIDRLMPFYLELWALTNPESPMPLGRWPQPTHVHLNASLPWAVTWSNLPLLYPTWATRSSLRLDFLRPQLQLHLLPHSCSVLMGGSPSFLALKQLHLPHPAEGPDHAQKNPDKEHFYSLTILQACSPRVALFPRTF